QNRGNGDELRIETFDHEARERGLAHARRAPEDHGMRPAGFKGHSKGFARAQQMRLTHDFVQCTRPHALSQRYVLAVDPVVTKQVLVCGHGAYCIRTTSTSGGTSSENASAARAGFAVISSRVMRVVCPKASRSSSRRGWPSLKPMSTCAKPASPPRGRARSQARPSRSPPPSRSKASSRLPEPKRMAAGDAPMD